MSLKSSLTNYIKSRGEISYKEMEEFLTLLEKKYRISTAERRLREIPEIQIITDGHITAYRWAGAPTQKISYYVEGKKVLTSYL